MFYLTKKCIIPGTAIDVSGDLEVPGIFGGAVVMDLTGLLSGAEVVLVLFVDAGFVVTALGLEESPGKYSYSISHSK
jgi:hypothetical protein